MNSIGSRRSHASVLLQQFGLVPFRAILTPDTFNRVARQAGCAPQRQRALTPEVIVWLMLCTALQTTSMTQGLTQAWGWVCAACFWLHGPCVTDGAFCQARQRLSLRFWRQLWRCLQDQYEQRFGTAMRWQGLRVLAVDGTEADVPNVPALVKFFTRPRTHRGESKAPQGRLVALCSVFTGFCIDFTFMSRLGSEHLALRHLIRRLRPNDLLLLDRGFFSLHRHASYTLNPSPLFVARAS
jgi:hypothetical protein